MNIRDSFIDLVKCFKIKKSLSCRVDKVIKVLSFIVIFLFCPVNLEASFKTFVFDNFLEAQLEYTNQYENIVLQQLDGFHFENNIIFFILFFDNDKNQGLSKIKYETTLLFPLEFIMNLQNKNVRNVSYLKINIDLGHRLWSLLEWDYTKDVDSLRSLRELRLDKLKQECKSGRYGACLTVGWECENMLNPDIKCAFEYTKKACRNGSFGCEEIEELEKKYPGFEIQKWV